MNSTTILQLNPSLPVVTPDGKGEAIGWIDYGKEDDLLWIVFLDGEGECWIYPNPQIRACPNVTLGRMPNISSADVRDSIPGGKLRNFRKAADKAKAATPLPRVSRPARNGHGHAASQAQTRIEFPAHGQIKRLGKQEAETAPDADEKDQDADGD